MKILLFCSVPYLLLVVLLFAESRQHYHVSPAAQAVHKILAGAAEKIQKKGKLRLAGEGVAMPGGTVRSFTLSFFTVAPYTRADLRGFLMEYAQELLEEINSSEEVRPYLQQIPFTRKNIELIIFNQSPDGRCLTDPEIAVARFSSGTFVYRTLEFEDSFGYKHEYEESYEEAKAILDKASDSHRYYGEH